MTQQVALEGRLIESATGALELLSVHLGRTLGLYDAITEPRTVAEVAATTGVIPRYAREWLEHQAVAGFVNVTHSDAAWHQRLYSVDESQTAAFIAPDHPAHVSPLADMVAGVGLVIDQVAKAYRSGDGVPYACYRKDFRDGDIVGYDSDAASIADAQANAAAADVSVCFEQADATALKDDGPFDLVLLLEALHDLAQPAAALSAVREALADDGALLVSDEKVAERFTAPGDELERMMYGWSVVHCLPAVMAETPSAAIGTVIRPDVIRALGREAGSGSVEQSDIDAGFFNLYAMRT